MHPRHFAAPFFFELRVAGYITRGWSATATRTREYDNFNEANAMKSNSIFGGTMLFKTLVPPAT
jgi:hypothetical protein